MTLEEILQPRTKEVLLALLLKQLAGLGWVRRDGFSSGGLALSGVPAGDYNLIVNVITAGQLGAAEIQYSLDSGASYSATTPIPSDGVFVFAGAGVTGQFTNGANAEDPSFFVGDTYSAELRKGGFPVTSWQPLSTPLGLAQAFAEAEEDVEQLTSDIGGAGFLGIAAHHPETDANNPWVDLHAEQFYNRPRARGIPTQGNVVLTDTASLGPINKLAGEVVVMTESGLRFINNAALTIPLDGSVTGVFQAESPGSAYNVALNAVHVLETSIPGVAVNNPGTSGSWITQSGTDDENDAQLEAACIARWPSNGIGQPTASYDTWAKAASASVTKTTSRVSPTVPGQVDLRIAGAGGGVSGGVIAAVNSYVNQRAPLTVVVDTDTAANFVVTVAGNVFVTAGFLAQATAQVAANLAALISSTKIGGTLYFTEVIEQIQRAAGVRNTVTTVNAGTVDLVLGGEDVATLTNNLTFSEV